MIDVPYANVSALFQDLGGCCTLLNFHGNDPGSVAENLAMFPGVSRRWGIYGFRTFTQSVHV